MRDDPTIDGQSVYDGLEPEARRRLKLYQAELLRWRGRVNLIGSGTWDTLWPTHFLDSLALIPLLPPPPPPPSPTEGVDIVDLGSGAGFPGLVIALATGRRVDLIESRRAKGEFLRETLRKTGASARLHVARIENTVLPAPPRGITARGLASLDDLLKMAARWADSSTVCLFPKGRDTDREIARARRNWRMDLKIIPARRGSVLRIGSLGRKTIP